LVALLLGGVAFAQQAPLPDANAAAAQMQQKLQRLSADLNAAQERLQQSEREIQRLQDELATLQAQVPGAAPTAGAAGPVVASSSVPSAQDTAEKVEVLQAEVKTHEQIKVESASKYPVRLTGLVVFNAFINKGAVDNVDVPSVAIPQAPGVSNLATGASIRQTILGIQATGPRLFGAKSSAEVNLDFYGGIPYSNYGTDGGLVRMRTAALRLTWDKDYAEVGLVEPIISPLSPTSYASVSEPALAWAGNLWTWAPQLSYKHRFGSATAPHFAWQAALWDPPAAGYNTGDVFRAPSAGERSAQPAYETRLSFARDDKADGLQVGLSGYYSRQSYTNRSGDSWAGTADWRLPVGRVFELSGEAYRGRALGGLGGGVYKDVVNGTDRVTGLATFRLLNAAGGWAQAKFRLTPAIEANAAFGEDGGFSRDFHSLVLAGGGSNSQNRARNRMTTLNMVFAPKTYLILSPEFRRIWTWPVSGNAYTANLFTLSFALRF